MRLFKGFDKDLKCRGFQYELGGEYREETADLCNSGFHACENPLDVFGYYAPNAGSRYCEVELDEVTDQTGDDSKRCGKVIRIGAELDIAGICKAHFENVKARCNPAASNAAGDNESASAGESGSASAGESGSASAGESGSASAGESGSASAGEHGIACTRGGKVKGGLGCAICCTELDDEGHNIGIAAAIVDGEIIKAETWYTVQGGAFVEVVE